MQGERVIPPGQGPEGLDAAAEMGPAASPPPERGVVETPLAASQPAMAAASGEMAVRAASLADRGTGYRLWERISPTALQAAKQHITGGQSPWLS